MAEARALVHLRAVWQNIKDFLAAHTINSIGSLLFLLLAIFLIWPIVAVLVKSVLGPEGFTLEYYKDFISHSYYYRSLFNSLFLGIVVLSLCIGAAFCIAYMTTRGPVYLRTPLRVLTLLPLLAPTYIFSLSLIMLLGKRGIITQAFGLSWNIYGFDGCVIAQTLAFVPLAYIMIESTLSSLNPNLEDSAANLGATEGKILRSITIPLLTPGFLKAALIVFVLTMSAFGNLKLLGGRTPFLAPDTYTMITGEADFNMAAVLSMFLVLPCAVVFIMQNYLLRGKAYTTIGGKPVAADPRHIGRKILIPMLSVSFIICGLNLLVFVIAGVGAFTQLLGVDNTFTLSHILNSRSNLALTNSVKISLLAGLFAAILGILLAYVVVRGKFKGRDALEGISLAGFTLPGTVLGIGYLLAFNKSPLVLTGTMIIMVLCAAFRRLAVSGEAGIAKLGQLSIEVEEASLNLGASTITTFRRIVLPIIFPAFIYGFMYGFMRTMIALNDLIFLVCPGFDIAAVYIFDMISYGQTGLACATTLKLMVIVAITLAILQYLSKWTGLSITRKMH